MKNFKEKLNSCMNRGILADYRTRYVLLALVLNLLIESLSRHHIFGGLIFLFTRPHFFIYNMLIILAIVFIGSFFKRRAFATFFLSAIWMIFGIMDCVLLFVRKTPLTFQDFDNVVEGFHVLPKYFNVLGIILIFAALAGAVFLIVLAAIRMPKIKGKVPYVKSGAFMGGVLVVTALLTLIGVKAKVLGTSFGNIAQAYKDYGFSYCFGSSVVATGVSKPHDYSEDTMEEVREIIDEEEGIQQEKPNMIFIQLESLFDPMRLKGVSYSEDPIPTIRKLMNDYPSGYLSVPSFGAGTANTEFEIITGMDLNDFGPGEYPYKTVLLDTVCESTAYYLKDQGYRTSVIHNNEGDFYSRNKVFPQLGFETFTSLEYMNGYELTYTGWAKDEILIDEIREIMNTTAEADYIYAISVEGHGDYPAETDGLDLPITVEDPDNVTGNPEAFRYYVNQIHEMDRFISKLIVKLAYEREDVVLVLYGDHLPTFDFQEESIDNGDLCTTQYVIWNNMGLPNIKKDLTAYQLSSEVLNRAGLSGGLIYKVHRAYEDGDIESEELYHEMLRLLEYDILYGDQDSYDGEYPYAVMDMQMGHKEIRITSADNVYRHVRITGENFTEYSKVFINDEECETLFNGPTELLVDLHQLVSGDIIDVRQIAASGSTWLSSTVPFTYNGLTEER